ncbi:hypothetical protein D0863_14031 [Hortaea werneckii]|uniref:Uncharacterized protein n=1 Tax=Hortaea werneckii TaxID=91943 RepID=A0A3M7CNC4_HORWE|nr:hypothetical protein D0863_14031 [Hortaea werneckii]
MMQEKPGVGKSESGGGAHKHVALALHVISARFGHVGRSELQLLASAATATGQLIFYETTRQLSTTLDPGSNHPRQTSQYGLTYTKPELLPPSDPAICSWPRNIECGLIAGLSISVFSKPLTLLIGLLIVGVQTAESYGIHVVPYKRMQNYFTNIDMRSAVQDNMAFKISFGALFALSAFAEF